MKFALFTAMALASLGHLAQAALSSIVAGTPMGFAAAVTGGGDAEPVYPTTIDELKTYLTSADPQVIVISGTFNFQGSEGSTVEKACNQYACTPAEGGQALLNVLNGCGDYPLYDVLLDTAALEGINVESNKTLVGRDNAVLYGKGLRFAGVSNIIVQNVAITNLNPRYVWGGDALVFADSSLIWIDHVATSYLGRQHYAFGQNPDKNITVSNSYLNGYTSNSATCDNHTYWAMELVGTDDTITWYKNHVYYTSGRTPALSGNTMFHAVNNIWEDNSGHLLEGTDNGKGLFEGNYYINTPLIADSGFVGSLFSSSASDVSLCTSALGRDCVENAYNNTGSFDFADTAVLSDLKGFSVVDPDPVDSIVSSLLSGAGNTL